MAERLAVLQTVVTAVQSNTLLQELRQAACQAAHKLAGVLGMFEKETGTMIARELEEILAGDSPLSPTQTAKVVSLVQELNTLLDLGESTAVEASSSTEIASLLLVDTDPELSRELQVLAQSVQISCTQMKRLESAHNWLRSHTPALTIVSTDTTTSREDSLPMLADLTARTPAVPVLVLAPTDGPDRVTVARAGAQGFLSKPVTAAQVWETATQLLQRARSQAINVLVVDDDPIFLDALRSLLKPWGIRMTGLSNPHHFWDMLQTILPDLLILDVEMPGISGVDLCQAVRIDSTWQSLPILFLTAHKDSQTVQQVFAAGADDYILKPVVGPELLTRISNRLERNRLLQTLSTKDPLTGLANQPQSSADLERLLQDAAHAQQPFCLVVLTVSELRSINIQYGHAAGNGVLQRWGQIFRTAFHSNEVLGYWGNGEFVVGLPGLRKAEMDDRLCDVLQTLRQQIFTAPDGERFQASCSAAVAEYPSDETTIHKLYRIANSS